MDTESDPFADEPTLPQLPTLPKDPSGHDTSGRKRAYPFRAPSTEGVPSSDIGVFSSDDDPALDNYVQARQKRRYRGTWYDHNRMMSDPVPDDDSSQEDVVPETPKAKARNRGSNEAGRKGASKTVGGAGHPPPTPPSSNPVQSHAFSPNRGFPSSQGFASSHTFSPGPRFASSQGLPSSQGYSTEPARKQSAVMQEIERRIDRGESVIDLTNMGLDDDSISLDTFRPLIDLRLVPRVKAQTLAGHSRDPLTMSKDGYLHRESPIVLIMAHNRLSRLPGTLFDIENLVELSLRHNQLTEVPPAIAKCRNLRSLNLSFNRLRWLPFELVQSLPRLRQLNIVGNDFYEPEPSSTDGWQFDYSDIPLSELPEHLRGEPHVTNRSMAWYVGRGPVQYTDTSGRTYSLFSVPTSGGERNQIPIPDPDEKTAPLSRYCGESQARPGSNQGYGSGRVPSLVELCARSLERSGRPEEFGDMSAEPDVLATVVAAAARSRYRGGRSCDVCRKAFVIPRTQWIEFFYRQRVPVTGDVGGIPETHTVMPSRSEILQNLIPCLRSGCSWRCVPYQTALRSGQMVPWKD